METERVCPLCGDEKVNELRAEAERLREALRDVAERQREACATRLDGEHIGPPGSGKQLGNIVRATPLVTKEKP